MLYLKKKVKSVIYLLFSYQTGYIMWHSRLKMYISFIYDYIQAIKFPRTIYIYIYYMLFSYQTGYIMWHSRLRIYIPLGAAEGNIHLKPGMSHYIPCLNIWMNLDIKTSMVILFSHYKTCSCFRTHGVYICVLMRIPYSRICIYYRDFMFRFIITYFDIHISWFLAMYIYNLSYLNSDFESNEWEHYTFTSIS
jgi:hypothetical protein